MKNKSILLVSILFLIFTSCEVSVNENESNDGNSSFENLKISKDFNFSTINQLDLGEINGQFGKDVTYIVKSVSDRDFIFGSFSGEDLANLQAFEVPASVDNLDFVPQTVGKGGNILLKAHPGKAPGNTANSQTGLDKLVAPIGGWNTSGVPNNLVSPDAVPQSLLDDISSSLPESDPLPDTNPEFLTGDNFDTQIVDSARVWATFVSEGAGFRNSLGYYTYPTGNLPASLSDIDTLHVIFPNVSFGNGTNGLQTGFKMLLGDFSAGTSIGWFLIPDGWEPSSEDITSFDQVKYTNPNLNDFTNQNNRQHTVVLTDKERELLVLGMEDISRPGGDEDFNDAVFYATVTPFTAVGNDTPDLKKTADSDGDGVNNSNDEFPDDPERAFKSFFPGENMMSSLLYEDLWPDKGDFDFNDLVLDYKITTVTNANNLVKDLQIDLKLKAVGGLLQKGFALSLPISASNIQNVSGQQLSTNQTFDLTANGVEDFGSTSIVPFFNDAHALLPPQNSSGVSNVIEGDPVVPPVEFEYTITLNSPINSGILGSQPFDFFMVVDQDRSKEVHLKGKPNVSPSVTANFGQGDDASDPSSNQFYQTASGLPWALNISEKIPHPIENADFSNAYPLFSSWAESDGQENIDWFQDLPGHRQNTLLFNNLP